MEVDMKPARVVSRIRTRIYDMLDEKPGWGRRELSYRLDQIFMDELEKEAVEISWEKLERKPGRTV